MINEFIDEFQRARVLGELNQSSTAQDRVFEELGIFEDPVFHLRLETCFSKQRRNQIETNKASKKSNHESILRKGRIA